ncbi:MAG: hypothetical protein H0X65_01655 [Gemmatimonadetes bacterium]|nr:hypothetical protein [Gemmatimonadota bacterium]
MARIALAVFLAVISSAVAAHAQQPPVSAPCEDAAVLLTAAEQSYCFAIAQTVESVQPQLGILIAQGNPTIGAAGTGGLRLGTLPRISATAQIGALQLRLPDVRRRETATTERLGLTVPALSGTVSAGVFPGISVRPGIGGIGSVDVLGSATWLPFNVVDTRGLASDVSEFAYGVGGRLGLLRESFIMPAASVSVMYRRLGRVSYGDVCPAGVGADLIAGTGRGYDFVAGACAVTGDPGEFAIDLSSWSGRAAVSKRLLGLGLAGGLGYDRYRSDVSFGVGATATIPGIGAQPVYIRGSGLRLDQDRWSAFVSGSYTLLITTVAAEAGWMQGGNGLQGFDAAASGFDPRRGTLFGGLGLRVSF